MENFIWGWMNELDDPELTKGRTASAAEKKVITLS